MRILKCCAGSLLVSAFILVATSHSQVDGAKQQSAASNSDHPEAQIIGTPQFAQPNDAPSGCSYKVPLTKDGDIKVDLPSGPASPPSAGIPAVPRCPMPPIEARPVIAPGETLQWVGYLLMFNNMEALDHVADNDEKMGNAEQAYLWRTHDGRAAGLNDIEIQILNETEADCMRAVHEQDRKTQAAIRKFRLATGGDIRAPIPPELFQMNDERYAIVQRHIDQLRVALGEGSFRKLDKYVHAVFAPHSQAPPVPKSTPPAGSR